MDEKNIFAVTQSIIAIVVVIGGGAFFFFRPGEDASAVVGVLGMVIGWYFRSAASSQNANQVIASVQAAKPLVEEVKKP